MRPNHSKLIDVRSKFEYSKKAAFENAYRYMYNLFILDTALSHQNNDLKKTSDFYNISKLANAVKKNELLTVM